MQISLPRNYNYINYQQSFSSLRRKECDSLGNVINCNYTNLNREDVNWRKFVRLLDERYANNDKVTIHFFGCSDGSDPYTLALYLEDEIKRQS